MHKCLIFGASQIVKVTSNGEKFLRGNSDLIKNLCVLNQKDDSNRLCLVSIDGVIQFVGYESDQEFVEKFKSLEYNERIDASGCSILPGLIDSHTHPVWEGDRINEFKMKLEGATYMQIHQAGGGIHFTVEHSKNASEEKLYSSLIERLNNFNRAGTTFVECKSGYGLEWETEFKLLRVLTKAKREMKNIGMTNTYLAAHAIPKGKTANEATQDIINHQLPKLRDLIEEKEIDVDNVDVFCEKGVYDVEQSESILSKAKELCNLNINFHSDELYPLNSVSMAVKLNSRAVSHLEEISDEEISLMSKSETVGILLPTTAIIMQLKRPPARKMLTSDCIVALGSDFNPNAFCYSMPLVMSLACVDLRLSMNEALVASTINSAFALGVHKTKGSIEVGKHADLLIIKSNRWENLIYQIGSHDNLIKFVLVEGRVVYER